MKRIPVFVLICVATTSVACGDTSGPVTPATPANAMTGTYLGSTSKADIRLQVEYGTEVCYGSFADCLVRDFLAENLHGSGTVALRASGEVQTFQLTGFEAVNVGITFHQDAGVMLGARLAGSPSSDGRTVQAFIYAMPSTAGSDIFGDSVAILLSRQ